MSYLICWVAIPGATSETLLPSTRVNKGERLIRGRGAARSAATPRSELERMFLGRRSTRARRRTHGACAICCWHTQEVPWFEGAVQTGASSCSCRCLSPAEVNARVIVSGEPAHASANDVAVGVDIITRTTTFSTTWLIWRTGRKTLARSACGRPGCGRITASYSPPKSGPL